MNQLDEFKTFVKGLPGLKNAVKNKEYTWQQLYEFYVMYGKEDKMWDEYKEDSTLSFDLSKISYILKNIDLSALSQSLDGIQKILSVASAFLVKDEDQSKESYRS